VCDVDEKRLAAAQQTAGQGGTLPRLPHIVARKDIDAVVIATPDHCHALQTVHACETGNMFTWKNRPRSRSKKEPPWSLPPGPIVRQSRSAPKADRTWRLVHLPCIRNGIVGKVNKVTCWHYANPVDENPVPDTAPPPELDWDLWLGPLPWRSYNPHYCPAFFAGSSSPAAARSAIAEHTSSAPFSGP